MREREFKLSVLEYSKVILAKISFDRKLFKKEYRKAFKQLDNHERATLKQWVRSQWRMIVNT